jgi:hypothetical protein
MNGVVLCERDKSLKTDDEVMVQFGLLRKPSNIRTLECAFEKQTRLHTRRINKSRLIPFPKDLDLKVTSRSYSAGIKENREGKAQDSRTELPISTCSIPVKQTR